MVIYGVSFDMVGKQPIILLKTLAGNRFLPIWIGHPEAASILMRLQGAAPSRPATHDLMMSMLEQLDVEVSQVAITTLQDNTFFSEITLIDSGTELTLDARPSDALAIAVRADVPIYTTAEILDESSIEFDHDKDDSSEDMIDKFRSFLEDVSPDDFLSQG